MFRGVHAANTTTTNGIVINVVGGPLRHWRRRRRHRRRRCAVPIRVPWRGWEVNVGAGGLGMSTVAHRAASNRQPEHTPTPVLVY